MGLRSVECLVHFAVFSFICCLGGAACSFLLRQNSNCESLVWPSQFEFRILLYSILLYCIILYSTLFYSIILYYIILCYPLFYSTYSPLLYYIISCYVLFYYILLVLVGKVSDYSRGHGHDFQVLTALKKRMIIM